MNPFSSPNEYELCLNCGGLGIVQDESGCLHQCDSCGGNELVLNPFYVDEGLECSCADWVIRPEEWELMVITSSELKDLKVDYRVEGWCPRSRH